MSIKLFRKAPPKEPPYGARETKGAKKRIP